MWKYAEDLIEIIAGYRDLTGKLLGPWNRTNSPLSLARYDIGILDSLAAQTIDNLPYTQKQSQLACKIILKYRKQLAKLSVYFDENTLQFRLGIRFVDQSKTIRLDKNRILLKFPYNPDWINQIKNMSQTCFGSIRFNPENKVWEIGITESTVNFLVAFGQSKGFDIDPVIVGMAESIIAVENMPYKIELTVQADKLIITNAATSLLEYIDKTLGGLTINNLYKLIDLSSVLEYTVDPKLVEQLAEHLNKQELILLLNRKIEGDQELSLESILSYASKTDRLPIYMYDTGTTKKDTEQIIYLNTKKSNKFIPKIKLMVSMSTLLVGFRKQDWISRAEKVIFLK